MPMEIPIGLKKLYRHWDSHVANEGERNSYPKNIPEEMQWFISERLEIWKKKTFGENPPYTRDPILTHYKFCNIFREFDAQTIAFHTLLNPLRDNFPLWFLNMFYCRMIARPQTIQTTGLLTFSKKNNASVLESLLASARPRFGTPYVFPISAIQKSETPTRELFATRFLPTILKAVASEIETWHKKSVYESVQEIIPIFGYNLFFLWTEVLIDTAYQFPDCIDLFARFPIGPGSLPTFKTLAPREDPSLFVEKLSADGITTSITYRGKPLQLSSENWEGIGCEYRKYLNLKSGRGRKRLYKN